MIAVAEFSLSKNMSAKRSRAAAQEHSTAKLIRDGSDGEAAQHPTLAELDSLEPVINRHAASPMPPPNAIAPEAAANGNRASDDQQPLRGASSASEQLPPQDLLAPVMNRLAASPMPPPNAVAPGAAVNGNRARFMAGLQPTKVSCDLTTTPVAPGLRFSFEAIVLVVYPASASPPERRYVELMDPHGSTGITVWNSHALAINTSSVGCVVKFTRLALTMHNGKKNLTMSKDSTMHLELPSYECMLTKWWKSLMMEPPLTCIQFHDTPTLSVVNIAGVLGCIYVEEKIVKGEVKNLLVLIITDRTGKVEIRSWNHVDTEFKRFVEKPILLKRVRVCLYAGTRNAELITGDNGTMITTDFDHSDLDKYWNE